MERPKVTGNRITGFKMKRRFRGIMIIIIVLFAVVSGKLIYVNVVNGDEYSKLAVSQLESYSTTVSARRGDITDANGVTLATSTKVYNLILDPAVILSDSDRYLNDTVSLLAEYFDYTAEELISVIHENENSNYIVLKRELAYSDIEAFQEAYNKSANAVGVWFEDSYKRNYPYETLASSVIGFMENGSGAYGIEAEYDEELTGENGIQYTYMSSNGTAETVNVSAVAGNTIVTTLDYNIQSIVEDKMTAMLKDTKADTIAVLIMNPNTGEIYAMADTDNFDCNNPRDLTVNFTEKEISKMSDAEITDALVTAWMNYCVTQDFEPGSTFKPFTLAMALEEKIVDKSDEFYCSGEREVQEETIHCYNRDGDGTVGVKKAITISCNITMMQIAEKIGVDIFTKYQSQFGFGKLSDIDLPNELSCSSLLYTAKNMQEIDLETNAFGQNFNTTMVQMASAFSSLINGGYYYKPYIVKNIYSEDGDLVFSANAELVSETISEETSDYIQECLRSVVTEGTATYADIKGYTVAGKTGTAEKGSTEEEDYVISFIGYAPYDNPEILCYVVIDNPDTGDSSMYASQLFNNIMTDVFPYMNISAAGTDDIESPASDENEDVEVDDEETEDAESYEEETEDPESDYEETEDPEVNGDE